MSNNPRRQVYDGYQGKENPSERDKVMHLLDEYGYGEGLVSEYLGLWLELSPNEALKGGLRTIREREAAHSRLLEARLRELGGEPQATIPAERREQSLALFASTEKSDVDKLQALAMLFADPVDFMKPVTDLVEQIQEDQQSKELLRTVVDDEWASIKWLVGMYQRLSEAGETA